MLSIRPRHSISLKIFYEREEPWDRPAGAFAFFAEGGGGSSTEEAHRLASANNAQLPEGSIYKTLSANLRAFSRLRWPNEPRPNG